MLKFLFNHCCKYFLFFFNLLEFLTLGVSVYLVHIRMYCVISPFW